MSCMNTILLEPATRVQPIIFTETVAGVPIRFSIYHRDTRITNDMHRFLVTNEPFVWLVMADPYGDMTADEFFSRGWDVRIFEGVSWRGYTTDAGERDDLLAQLRQRIADDVADYLAAAQRRGMDELLAAMCDYTAMVLDYQFQDGFTAFLAALAEFAASSWTCPGCGIEQPEDTGCGDCGRCDACCTCQSEDEPVICPDCGLALEDCCCCWDGPYWSFDWRKAKQQATE
ncbi:MAG TPA: hypothetical protein VHO69_17890 [Phototrophicaceae bacterium]|nr:hypothetical protein [Phototrophicaceae bacterium]